MTPLCMFRMWTRTSQGWPVLLGVNAHTHTAKFSPPMRVSHTSAAKASLAEKPTLQLHVVHIGTWQTLSDCVVLVYYSSIH